MLLYKKHFFVKICSFLSLLFLGCIDPVTPEFEFKEGLVFVEGFVSTSLGASFVIISESVKISSTDKTVFVDGASVSFKNVNTGETISLIEQEKAYVPPSNFKTLVGETWQLKITMPNGEQYESLPELVLNPVEISNIQATYDPELRVGSNNKFEPGHYISVTFDDPEGEENFYYWTFRSFENLTICEICYDGIFRNNHCEETSVSSPPFFSYPCQTSCWKIRFPESISIFDDKFSNGKTTTNLKIAEIPLVTKENMVVEIQQFSITPAAYEYYKILKDIVDNSGGFNAPPPAALIGNMININDDEDFIFGRFTAAATSTENIFINRESIIENAIEFKEQISLEPTLMSPYPPPVTITIPCSENFFRTAIRPDEWID